jgi:hypothetical protein
MALALVPRYLHAANHLRDLGIFSKVTDATSAWAVGTCSGSACLCRYIMLVIKKDLGVCFSGFDSRWQRVGVVTFVVSHGRPH